MGDGTKIEWTDATWNIVNGCSVLSPGCTNCYAMKLAGTRLKHVDSRAGLTIETKAGPVWNGTTKFNEPVLLDPIRWKRPRKIFVCAHGDLFHESVPDEWIDRVFAVMALAPHHVFQVLTKRADRMRAYVSALVDGQRGILTAMSDLGAPDTEANAIALFGDASPGRRRPLPNVWLGVSVEDQPRADQRREDLRATPAAKHFVSFEPALEVVDWAGWEFLDWLISGGESGNNARYVDHLAYRTARDWCAAEGVAFLHKQNGVHDEAGNWVGKKAAGRLLDGVEHNGYPS